MRLNRENIDEVFKALALQLKVQKGEPISIVVCGGTALAALGLVERTTRDVDVLASVVEKEGEIHIEELNEFPQWFKKASDIVARDFGLPEEWINLGPAPQVKLGLPDGFEKRLVKKIYGDYLTVYFISRIDQIHFKLYASVDRNSYHVEDLLKLNPSEAEIEQAAHWVLTQDTSQVFRKLLKSFLKEIGYEKVAERI